MRGGCAPLVCDGKVGRTFGNFCSLLRRVLRGVARTLAWMCILCGSVLRGHRKSLVNYSVLCKLNCCECPFLTAPSNFPILPVIILLTCPHPPQLQLLYHLPPHTIHRTIHLSHHFILYVIPPVTPSISHSYAALASKS